MARTREFDERQALVAAMLTFWEKGYEGTSIQDLEHAMGLGRTSIYNAFGNKRRIFERVVACYRESILSSLLAAVDSTPDIRLGVRRLFKAALDVHFADDSPGGCLVVLSIAESEQHDAHSQASLEQVMRDMKRALQSRLNKAKKSGQLAQGLDTGSVATTISTALAGMMVLGKANTPRQSLNKVADQIVSLLD